MKFYLRHSERPQGAKNLASANKEIPFGCAQDMLQSLSLLQNNTEEVIF